MSIEQLRVIKTQLDDIYSKLETLNKRYSDTLEKILEKTGCGEKFVNDDTELDFVRTLRTPTSPDSTSTCRDLIEKSKSLLVYINKKEIQKKRIRQQAQLIVSLIKQSKSRSVTLKTTTRSPSPSSGKTKRSFFSLFSKK